MLFPSASPFVCWLLLCWSVDRLQRWPQSPSDKRGRKQRGIGITSFRWPSTETERGKRERQGGEKDYERLRHIILLSLIVRAGLSMHGCGCWGHTLTTEPYLLSPLRDTVELDSARFNHSRTGDLPLLTFLGGHSSSHVYWHVCIGHYLTLANALTNTQTKGLDNVLYWMKAWEWTNIHTALQCKSK